MPRCLLAIVDLAWENSQEDSGHTMERESQVLHNPSNYCMLYTDIKFQQDIRPFNHIPVVVSRNCGFISDVLTSGEPPFLAAGNSSYCEEAADGAVVFQKCAGRGLFILVE